VTLTTAKRRLSAHPHLSLPAIYNFQIGDARMNSIKPTILVTVLFAAAFAASAVQAGDVKGKVSGAGLKSVENVVVYLDAIPGKKFDPPSVHATMDQANMKFVPHILVISRGSTVDFKNSDQVAHNIYWPSIGGNKALRHNLTIVSPDHTKVFQFDNSGAAQLLCNLHPEMLGFVVVAPTPYFALTSSDGSFTLKNVPPGTYTLKTWSEDGKSSTQSITVTDSTANMDVVV
jgi:plastocyanin